MTRPGIESWSPGPLANTLLVKPMARSRQEPNNSWEKMYSLWKTPMNLVKFFILALKRYIDFKKILLKLLTILIIFLSRHIGFESDPMNLVEVSMIILKRSISFKIDPMNPRKVLIIVLKRLICLRKCLRDFYWKVVFFLFFFESSPRCNINWQFWFRKTACPEYIHFFS